jgi:hypothetical protein
LFEDRPPVSRPAASSEERARPVVNKISWQKAGGITEPGRYMFTFGWLTVTAEDLAIWKQFPDAMFTVIEIPHGADEAGEFHAEEFHLGAFELPQHPSPSGRT